jgi:predicted Zn finger-like uncharacterized protein
LHILPESRQIMRIVCPSCAATYEVAEAMLARPRTVRCSRCAREWTEEPAQPVAKMSIAEPVTEPEAPAISEPAAPVTAVPDVMLQAAAEPAVVLPPPGPDRSAMRLRLAWIVSVLLLMVLAFLTYHYRAEIQAAWPPSARLFRLLPGQPAPTG